MTEMNDIMQMQPAEPFILTVLISHDECEVLYRSAGQVANNYNPRLCRERWNR